MAATEDELSEYLDRVKVGLESGQKEWFVNYMLAKMWLLNSGKKVDYLIAEAADVGLLGQVIERDGKEYIKFTKATR